MKLLAFESSAKAAGVAVLDDGRLLAEYFQNSGQTHSRTLMQMAENLLKTCDLEPQNIDACAVADGPGSFTGVRIGVAAAKGFSWGREIACYGVSTLEAMARGAAITDGVFCCCMDARRAQVYNAVFEKTGSELVRLREDRAISLDDLCEDLQNIEKPIFLVGDGAQLCYNTCLDMGIPAVLAPGNLVVQSAWGVAMAAFGQTPAPAEELLPVYLRLSQAERERQARLAAQAAQE